MLGLVIIGAIIISIGCWFVWSWANDSLFTYLGEVETVSGIEKCWGYDALTWPARIVAFLCGVAAIIVFELTWFGVCAIVFL